jgi:hypothetical protein
MAHRLAWLYVHGEWPTGQIDHINGVKSDNRIQNLRPATCAENNRNVVKSHRSVDLPRGVRRRGKRYEARIRDGERQVHLGSFATPEEASQSYQSAASKLHGAFACFVNSRAHTHAPAREG